MIAALFMSLAFLSLFGFISIGGVLSRAIYLKATFDFAAIAVIGLQGPDHHDDTRIISICMVVIGITVSFLYFIIQRQKDALQDEP